MDHKQLLLAELDAQRAHVRATMAGLTSDQLMTPVPPTAWAPVQVAHHLALDVERWWFQAVVSDDAQAWDYFDANPDGAWEIPAETTDPLALYVEEAARSDAVIESLDLDMRPDPWPDFLGRPKSLFEIVVHVIGETAAHAGQLDVVREAIDGHQHLVMD